MKRIDISKIVKTVSASTAKHAPGILLGIGLAGLLSAIPMAVKATPKAMSLMEEEKKKQRVDNLAPKDVVKVTWKCYIPTAATAALSVGCIIASNKINERRRAALATAYALSESALKEYQDKVVETIGKKKERDIQSAIAKDKVEKNPVTANQVVVTNAGGTLCYDTIIGRYFKSDKNAIEQAVNKLNYRMRDEMYVSLNDLYSELGLESVGVGDELGWDVNRDGWVEMIFDSFLTDDGTPCLTFTYRVAPRYDYRNLM